MPGIILPTIKYSDFWINGILNGEFNAFRIISTNSNASKAITMQLQKKWNWTKHWTPVQIVRLIIACLITVKKCMFSARAHSMEFMQKVASSFIELKIKCRRFCFSFSHSTSPYDAHVIPYLIVWSVRYLRRRRASSALTLHVCCVHSLIFIFIKKQIIKFPMRSLAANKSQSHFSRIFISKLDQKHEKKHLCWGSFMNRLHIVNIFLSIDSNNNNFI